MVNQIDADYNTNLILAYFKMEWEPRFGLLIFAPPPLNVVSLIFTPFLLLTQRYCPAYTVWLNTFFTKIVFSFIAIVMFAIFFLGSLILMPFAYIKGLIIYPKQAWHTVNQILLAVIWVIGGIFILVYYFFKDLLNFCWLVYKDNQSKWNEINIEEEDYWNLDLRSKFKWKLGLDELCALSDTIVIIKKNHQNDIKEEVVPMS